MDEFFTHRVRPKLPKQNCKNCGKQCAQPEHIYCNQSCKNIHLNRRKFEKGILSREATKRILILLNGHRCCICRRVKWMNQKIPLVMDHIDGNSLNNMKDNLRLVCGNCDMGLPTYKNKNKGKGRAYRRDRYSKGLTY